MLVWTPEQTLLIFLPSIVANWNGTFLFLIFFDDNASSADESNQSGDEICEVDELDGDEYDNSGGKDDEDDKVGRIFRPF